MYMKRKFKGITVPYLYYNKRGNYTCYIYQDNEYTDLNKLFTDFLGSYLVYHYEVKGTVKEVHNLSDVLYETIKNKGNINIPKKYKKEYSDNEYQYIMNLKDKLINKELKIGYNQEREYYFDLKYIKEYKLFKFTKAIYEKYKDLSIPKLIYSEDYKRNYYVVAGSAYESIYHALDEVFDDNLYYEFGGTKRNNNRSHSHSHSFDDLINLIFNNSSKFKIHLHQQQFYSKQELDFLNLLATKLKKMNFHSIEKKYDPLDSEEYIYLKENKKVLSLILNNIRYYKEEKKYQKDILKSHKI